MDSTRRLEPGAGGAEGYRGKSVLENGERQAREKTEQQERWGVGERTVSREGLSERQERKGGCGGESGMVEFHGMGGWCVRETRVKGGGS